MQCYNVSSAKQLLTESLNISVSPPVAVLGGGCSLVTQHIANDNVVARIPIVSDLCSCDSVLYSIYCIINFLKIVMLHWVLCHNY